MLFYCMAFIQIFARELSTIYLFTVNRLQDVMTRTQVIAEAWVGLSQAWIIFELAMQVR